MISTARPAPLYNTDYEDNYLLMGGGTNDVCGMISDARTVANIFTDWTTYITDRQSEGFIVIPRTVLPRSQPACGNIINFEADRQILNTLIRDYCTTNSITLNDIGNDPTIGQDEDSDNLTYYNAYKVHLTTAGANILVDAWGDALLTLI